MKQSLRIIIALLLVMASCQMFVGCDLPLDDELGYTEGEWLASYLINRHGLSAFLHYCMDEGVSFEAAFGMPYETAKTEWLQTRTLLD